MDQEYIDVLTDLGQAIDEGLISARSWVLMLIEQRKSVDIRIQEARAELYGIILQKDYELPHDIQVFIREHYEEDLSSPVKVIHIGKSDFILEHFGFQYSIPLGMIKELS